MSWWNWLSCLCENRVRACVCAHASVTTVTFSDGSSPQSLTSLSLSASVPPDRDRTPWAKVLPQNCLQPSLNPKISHHLPSELHATVQAPADTQETPNRETHCCLWIINSLWDSLCEMNKIWSPRHFYRLLLFISLWYFSELVKAWRTWGPEKVCISLLLRFFYFILLFSKNWSKPRCWGFLLEPRTVNTYTLSIPQLFLTRMLPTIIKLKLIFFPQHHNPPNSLQFCLRCFKKKKKTEVALALHLFRD